MIWLAWLHALYVYICCLPDMIFADNDDMCSQSFSDQHRASVTIQEAAMRSAGVPKYIQIPGEQTLLHMMP